MLLARRMVSSALFTFLMKPVYASSTLFFLNCEHRVKPPVCSQHRFNLQYAHLQHRVKPTYTLQTGLNLHDILIPELST